MTTVDQMNNINKQNSYILEEKQNHILKSIQDLQNMEKYLFQTLQKEVSKTPVKTQMDMNPSDYVMYGEYIKGDKGTIPVDKVLMENSTIVFLAQDGKFVKIIKVNNGTQTPYYFSGQVSEYGSKKLNSIPPGKYILKQVADSTGSPDEKAQQELIDQINELSDMRKGLFNDLQNSYSSVYNELTDDREQLTTQMSMVKVVENELNRLKKNVNTLQNNKINKMRMVEINDYEADKYAAHSNVMKLLALAAFGVLVVSLLFKFGFIPGIVSSVLLFTIFVITLFFVMRDVMDLYSRSDFDFNKYDFEFEPQQGKKYQTVLQHDEAFFKQLGGSVENNFKDIKSSVSDDISGLTKKVNSMESEGNNIFKNLTKGTTGQPQASEPKNAEAFTLYN
jgi:hypothetical protein